MARRLAPPSADEIACVPATFRARRVRGYHPAEALAAALAARLEIPFVRRRLVKRRETEVQSGLPLARRAVNVRGAFRAAGRPAARVLLVDDVATSGATARECSAACSAPEPGPSPCGASRAPRAPTSGTAGAGVRMNALNAAIVRTLPLVPKAIVRRIASRYVAGETLEQALGRWPRSTPRAAWPRSTSSEKTSPGTTRPSETVQDYARPSTQIAARGLDSNISVKLTALGLKLDPKRCRAQFARIVDAARATTTSCGSTWRTPPSPRRRSASISEFREKLPEASASCCRRT